MSKEGEVKWWLVGGGGEGGGGGGGVILAVGTVSWHRGTSKVLGADGGQLSLALGPTTTGRAASEPASSHRAASTATASTTRCMAPPASPSLADAAVVRTVFRRNRATAATAAAASRTISGETHYRDERL